MTASTGAIVGSQPAHQHGGGEEPAADLGDHAFGEGELPVVGLQVVSRVAESAR